MTQMRWPIRQLIVALAALTLVSFSPDVVGARPAVGPPVQLAQRSGDVHVRGYTRKDGTNVQPHWRSAPDGNPYNNYSFPGNTNPYTDRVAPGNPSTYLQNYSGRGVGSSPSSEMRPGETRLRPDGSIYVAPLPEPGR